MVGPTTTCASVHVSCTVARTCACGAVASCPHLHHSCQLCVVGQHKCTEEKRLPLKRPALEMGPCAAARGATAASSSAPARAKCAGWRLYVVVMQGWRVRLALRAGGALAGTDSTVVVEWRHGLAPRLGPGCGSSRAPPRPPSASKTTNRLPSRT